jgi:hypothetical protein
MTVLRKATPERLSAFSDGVFAVLITERQARAADDLLSCLRTFLSPSSVALNMDIEVWQRRGDGSERGTVSERP